MSHLPVLPVLLPLVTAALCFVAWRSVRAQRVVAVAGGAALLAIGGILLAATLEHGTLLTRAGGWPAPFGITLAVDVLSALMVLLAGLMGLAVTIYSIADIDEPRQRSGYFPFLFLMLTGICGSFVTADVFNLYVWFEVMLIGSFALVALGGERAQMEGAMKYVTLNLVGSAIFLAGAGVLYATVHTLNMGDLSTRLAELAETRPDLVTALASMFLVAFGLKSGLFPLYFWLPASYATPPAAVSAVFAGLLTKVGVYTMIRMFGVVFPVLDGVFTALLVAAGLTMVLGVFGAVSQFEIRKILSFHIISQIGYMTAALALLSHPEEHVRRLALVAAVFYIAHHIVVKTNLFLVGGVVKAMRGTYDLKRLGGLSNAAPWLAVLFLVPAFSLAGIPPLSGFWAKLAVIRAGFEAGEYLLIAAALVAGLLTLVSMIKIWNEAFWKPSPEPAAAPSVSRGRLLLMVIPIAVLALVTVAIGLWPQALYDVASRAADQLIDVPSYRELVGGAR
ncbi:MAG: proton-conducting transporter membrane subunit [Planctomycetota bacterium]